MAEALRAAYRAGEDDDETLEPTVLSQLVGHQMETMIMAHNRNLNWHSSS
jgi:hypothetical protein